MVSLCCGEQFCGEPVLWLANVVVSQCCVFPDLW